MMISGGTDLSMSLRSFITNTYQLSGTFLYFFFASYHATHEKHLQFALNICIVYKVIYVR